MMKINNPPWELMAKAKGTNKTASGPVVSISDAAAAPLRSLLVNIEPVQDLHGYDNPWPAGGGKNKFTPVTDGTYESNGIKIVAKNGVLTFSGTSTASGNISIPFDSTQTFPSSNDFDFCLLNSFSSPSISMYLRRTGADIHYWTLAVVNREVTSWTSSADETFERIVFSFASGVSASGTVSPMLVKKNEANKSTFTPYSNVCPISGWSEVNAWRTGVNVCDEEWENGYIYDGREYGSNECIRSKNCNPVVPNTTYYLYCGSATNEYFVRPYFYDADKSFISKYAWCANGTFTTPENCFYVRLATQSESTAKYGGTYLNDISINYPSTDHDYHPYSGNQYTIQLGQTVYGSTLDVTNGVWTVTRAGFTFRWGDYKAYSTQGSYTRKSIGYEHLPAIVDQSAKRNAICSIAPYVQSDVSVDDPRFYFSAGNLLNLWLPTDLDDNTQIIVVYPLATPITIPLTPQEISTLQGQNNVWADSGDVELIYKSNSPDVSLMKLAIAFINRR